MRGWLLLVAAVALAVPVYTQEPTADEITGDALRAALVGDVARVRTVARLRRLQEEQADREGRLLNPLAENVEALALALNRPLPTEYQAEVALGDYGEDAHTRNLLRLLRVHEPRERFLQARADRRYEHTRALVNGVLLPLGEAAQGQFFSLITLPFEALDWWLVGRRYLTPVQRRELARAREVLDAGFPSTSRTFQRSRRVVREYEEDRVRLARLQARRNGEEALDGERVETALFWYNRELALRGNRGARLDGHERALELQARQRARRDAARRVVDGDALFFSPDEFGVYTKVLRDLILLRREDHATELAVDFPTSRARDDAAAARAAIALQRGDGPLARATLAQLASDTPRLAWEWRAAAFQDLPRYGPERHLREAEKQRDRRLRAYLLQGRDLVPGDTASLSAEEARRERAFFLARARALFLTDTISRVIFLPFALPIENPALLDAGGRVPESFLEGRGSGWKRQLAREYLRNGRYTRAEALAREAGDGELVAETRSRAARQLERLGDREADPARRIVYYQRLLNSYPEAEQTDRVRNRLEEAREERDVYTTVERDELLAYPALWADDALPIDGSLLDGDVANGEIGRDGIALLRSNAVSYLDRRTGNRVEVPAEAGQMTAALRFLEPRRRTQALNRVLAEPLSRPRLPLALEAGLLPGFDIGPRMVPLRRDPAEYELYR